MDAGLDGSAVGEVPDRLGVFETLLRELTAIFSRPNAHDREALDQGHVDRNIGDAA